MQITTLDFETFWSQDYSLSKMTPLEYVMDPRFELISCAVKIDHHPTDVLFGEAEIRRTFAKLDWSKKLVIGHNMSAFDSYIMAYKLQINPRMWGCTLAMARPIHAKTTGLSLARLVAHYADQLRAMGISPVKDNTALVQTRGKRLADFTPAEIEAMRVYNTDDDDQCYGLFQLLRRHYTAAELWQIDALIRMRTEPRFDLDRPRLEVAASIERDRKHAALLELAKMLGLDRSDPAAAVEAVRTELASAPKFAALLEQRGVEVPMKPGKPNPDGSVKMIPALAKTDEAFLELQEHEDTVVATAALCRLDVKSTLLETRIAKLLRADELAGKLPVPLRYCGADTTGRDSGEEYNMQNLPRINPDKPKVSDSLRFAVKAPPGYVVMVADQSGIELRVNHFLWKVPSSMALFQANAEADLYREFAARYYAKTPEQIVKQERQFGKVCQLGLGFGSGAITFRRMARTQYGVRLTEEQAESGVVTWRGEYTEITDGWKRCAQGVLDIADGYSSAVDPWGLVHTCPEGFVLPSGRLIRYPNLRKEEDGEWPDGRTKWSWFYGVGKANTARITGPKADENIVQALARDSIFDCALEFFKLTGLRPALRVHDELVYVVPEKEAETLLALLQSLLRRPPTWWPQLVVWSEGSFGPNYGEAK
jgi:hypothetical protein